MVRDKNGRKMSKSLGNVIDPMEVIHGCLLGDLLKKIDDGNLPEKEVSKKRAFCVELYVCYKTLLCCLFKCAIAFGGDANIGPCFRCPHRTVNSTYHIEPILTQIHCRL